jgi:hypothetical protein
MEGSFDRTGYVSFEPSLEGGGFGPVPRRLTSFCNIWNQNGPPSTIAKAVTSRPKIFSSQNNQADAWSVVLDVKRPAQQREW